MRTREIKMPEKPETNLTEAIAIRHEDIVITISAEKNGVLQGRTDEQILKFCADLLLQSTDEGSLENQLDIITSIQETLEESFGFNKLDATNFMTEWRHRLYRKQIGDQNPPTEEFRILRPLPVEPSSDAEQPEQTGTPGVVLDRGMVTISIPLTNASIEKPEDKEPNSFSLIDREKK